MSSITEFFQLCQSLLYVSCTIHPNPHTPARLIIAPFVLLTPSSLICLIGPVFIVPLIYPFVSCSLHPALSCIVKYILVCLQYAFVILPLTKILLGLKAQAHSDSITPLARHFWISSFSSPFFYMRIYVTFGVAFLLL